MHGHMNVKLLHKITQILLYEKLKIIYTYIDMDIKIIRTSKWQVSLNYI
jgi:hypothetical protein